MQRSQTNSKSSRLPPSQLTGFVKLRKPPPKTESPTTTTSTMVKVLPSIIPKSSSQNDLATGKMITAKTWTTSAASTVTTTTTFSKATAAAAGTGASMSSTRPPSHSQAAPAPAPQGASTTAGREEESVDKVTDMAQSTNDEHSVCLPKPDEKAVKQSTPTPTTTTTTTTSTANKKDTKDDARNANVDAPSTQDETASNVSTMTKKKPEKTDEEWDEEAKALLKKSNDVFEKTKSVPVKTDDGRMFTEEFKNHVLKIYFSYRWFRKLPFAKMRKARIDAADAWISSGSVKVLCDAIIDVHDSGAFECSEDKEVALNQQKIALVALANLRNYADCSDPVTFFIRDYPRLLEAVVDWVRKWTPNHLAKTAKKAFEDGLNTCVSIIHNVSMREENIQRFRELDTTNSLLPILDSHKDAFKLSALASLADIVSEEEADKLAADPALAKFLLNRLETALSSKDHRCYGWSVTELVRAVRRLGRNDANKRLLVDLGALPLLAKGVQSEFEDEQIGCMEAVWVLSFDTKNVEEIVKNEELLDHVIKCSHDHALSPQVRHSAAGILWQSRDELQKSDKYKDTGKKIAAHKKKPRKKKRKIAKRQPQTTENMKVDLKEDAVEEVEEEEEEDDGIGHVMLSYQWSNQQLVKQIRDILRARGFKVWMDIDDMGGSTLQAMAAAIENAFVVLICMSQKYKDSSNTRAEAEYAFQQRKTIVPLIMERGYRPDGWLGMILGSKLFYDFSGKYTFESRIEGLVKEVAKTAAKIKGEEFKVTDVGAAGGGAGGDKLPQLVRSDDAAAGATTQQCDSTAVGVAHAMVQGTRALRNINMQMIKAWKAEDVKKWLTPVGLKGTELERLTGKEIVFLHSLRTEAPEYFYNTLEKKLHISTLSGLMAFIEAMDSLPT